MTDLLPVATATSTGYWTGVPSAVTKQLQDSFTFSVDITGAPSAVSVTIEYSVGNSAALDLVTHAFTAGELTATVAGFSIVGKNASRIRYNITITGGTSPTATVRLV